MRAVFVSMMDLQIVGMVGKWCPVWRAGGSGRPGPSPPYHLNSHSLGGLISAMALRWRKNFGSFG
jgi:hypothetical protein